jgi:hypothetical protein
VLLSCRIVKKGEDSYTVTYRAGKDGPEQTMDVGLVMMATGRHPRVESLNLQVRSNTPTAARPSCYSVFENVLCPTVQRCHALMLASIAQQLFARQALQCSHSQDTYSYGHW